MYQIRTQDYNVLTYNRSNTHPSNLLNFFDDLSNKQSIYKVNLAKKMQKKCKKKMQKQNAKTKRRNKMQKQNTKNKT